MERNYEAVPYKAVTHHSAVANEKAPWDNTPAYDTSELRYRIVSTETGEVLDDAQGYGYKTAQKAYAAYAYKMRDRKKDKERGAKKRQIEKWMKEHRSFVRLMDDCAFEIAKGTMAPGAKFDAKFVRKLLAEQGLETDFTAGELLKVWRGR